MKRTKLSRKFYSVSKTSDEPEFSREMTVKTFDPALLTKDNLKQIASTLRVLMGETPITLKVVRQRGKPEIIEGIVLIPTQESDESENKGGVRDCYPEERGGMTNSSQLGFVFRSHAFHFETSDDPVIERLGENSFRITNRRTADGENPIVEIFFSVGAAAAS